MCNDAALQRVEQDQGSSRHGGGKRDECHNQNGGDGKHDRVGLEFHAVNRLANAASHVTVSISAADMKDSPGEIPPASPVDPMLEPLFHFDKVFVADVLL